MKHELICYRMRLISVKMKIMLKYEPFEWHFISFERTDTFDKSGSVEMTDSEFNRWEHHHHSSTFENQWRDRSSSYDVYSITKTISFVFCVPTITQKYISYLNKRKEWSLSCLLIGFLMMAFNNEICLRWKIYYWVAHNNYFTLPFLC